MSFLANPDLEQANAHDLDDVCTCGHTLWEHSDAYGFCHTCVNETEDKWCDYFTLAQPAKKEPAS